MITKMQGSNRIPKKRIIQENERRDDKCRTKNIVSKDSLSKVCLFSICFQSFLETSNKLISFKIIAVSMGNASRH